MTSQLRRGAQLPYKLLAGVEPLPSGWLVVSAKMQGVTMVPEPAQVLPTFADVLDYRPFFEIIAVHIPIGLLDRPQPGGRTCDREARRMLGPVRGTTVVSAPARAAIGKRKPKGLSAVAVAQLPRIREVNREVSSYHQKTVFEVHPELGFFQLNGQRPMQWRKDSDLGVKERFALLTDKLHGIERVIDNRPRRAPLPRLLDACADLWTARRIAARSVTRIPLTPEWDSQGLKMEFVC